MPRRKQGQGGRHDPPLRDAAEGPPDEGGEARRDSKVKYLSGFVNVPLGPSPHGHVVAMGHTLADYYPASRLSGEITVLRIK